MVFVDSDDLLPLSAIKDLIVPAERYGTDVVIGNSKRLYVAGIKRISQIVSTIPNDSLPLLIEGKELFDKYYISFYGINILPVSMWGRIYRRSVIDLAMKEECLFDKNCLHMGEDEYFNLKLFPYLKSVYLIDKVVYTYRFGGITSAYNRYLTELFYFGDIRLKLLDKFNYEKGYFPLFFEYKNILFSEIQQRIQYLHEDKSEIVDFITKEINNRYLVERMTTMCRDDVPDSLKLLVYRDCEAIYDHAVEKAKANKWGFMMRELVCYLSRILRFL